jgi:hypothetical protein
MTSNCSTSRRHFLALAGALVGTAAGTAAFSRRAYAEDLVKLTETDATASALGYREDASKVDAAKFPAHQASQSCANCKFYLGADKSASAGCQLFPTKSVAAKGWCSAYNAKG